MAESELEIAESPTQGTTALAPPPGWPELGDEALYGLPGEIVQVIEPYTEADKVAVLVTLLSGFGNLVGDGPHFLVESTRHPLRINAVLVGDTSGGRKGQSLSAPRRILGGVDPGWADEHIVSGLSSGEGLVYHVRDSMNSEDQGVPDKRLWVIEEEFSRVLKQAHRDGNILSDVVRQSWDSGSLRVLTKNNAVKSTGAHVSIIGHITQAELLRHMGETEQANGFGNRFLWLRVRRSKIIPDAQPVPDSKIKSLRARLSKSREFALQLDAPIVRDATAAELWAAVYPMLTEGKPLLVGALLARGAPQVMRLACVYSVADLSPIVKPDHLKAALALWDYSEASVKSIFGDRLGDDVADRIMAALRENSELTTTQIHALFSRNHPAARMDTALSLLKSAGLADYRLETTGGAPRVVWFPATN